MIFPNISLFLELLMKKITKAIPVAATVLFLSITPLQASLFGKLKQSVTGKKDTNDEVVMPYEPVKYEFEMPKSDVPSHNMKIIYTSALMMVDGSSSGIEQQLDHFKNEIDQGFKEIIKAKKFNIYHEIEDPMENAQNMPQHELLKLAMASQQDNSLDAMLKKIPYVKKKRSSALVKTHLSIQLKYEMYDASNGFKKILVGSKIKKGYLHFSGDVSIEYIEPMTQEILVQQKFSLQSGKAPVQISYNDQSGLIQWETSEGSGAKIYSSDHIEALDNILKNSYKDVMANYFEYLSAEELLDLKEIIDELKGKKKY
jgi:hypothetical protein